MEENITFQDLGLSEAMLKALEKKGYGYPTTIQAEAIPHFLQWRDVIAKAPTGTGKTFAFSPMKANIFRRHQTMKFLKHEKESRPEEERRSAQKKSGS